MNKQSNSRFALLRKALTKTRLLSGVAVVALAGSLAYAAAPTAGTSIGNQASATYTDGSNTTRNVTSNTVQTIVQQVSSLTLTANGTKTSSPGSTVYYPHTLTNTGNGSDTFTLGVVNASGFTMTGLTIYADNGSGQPTGPAITSTGPLAGGAAFKFVVAATVGGAVISGATNTLTVTGTSGFGAVPPSVTNTDTTTVTANAVINVTKAISVSSGAAGTGPYTYTLTYTNTGNNTALAVKLTDVIPTGMTYVAGSGLWSITGATALTDAAADTQGTAPNTIDYAFATGTVTATIGQVTPGQSGSITFKVNVNAGVAPSVINNTAGLQYNDGSGTTVNGGSNTVPFTVLQVGAVTLTPPAAVPTANPGATVSFTNVVTNTGNGTDTFNITFANPGAGAFPAGTTFQLFKSDGVTPLVDTNGDGIPDTGPLAPAATYNVILKAVLPASISGTAPYSVNKTATSTFDPTKSSTGADTLTAITAATVDLTNNSVAGPGVGTGPEAAAQVTNATNPGTTTVFTLYAHNTSGVADAYNLTASTDSTFAATTLPTGWTVTFKADGGAGNCSTTGATITNTGTVNVGASVAYCAVVTIPASGAGSLAGNNALYFRVLSPATGALDVIHDQVTTNAVRSLTFSPNNTGQVYPAGSVVYSHTLTNTGNVTEGNGTTLSTITLTNASSKAGWTSVQYYDADNNGALTATDPVIPAAGLSAAGILPGGLAPGQSITIFDKVFAPSGANPGDINATTVTVTTANGTTPPSATPPAVVTAADSTTVIAGNVTILKEQALDAACNGTVGAYGTGNITVGAVPGACIRYRITVTNVGSADATSVSVSDATPAYTVYDNGGGAAAAATTVGTITAPTTGSAGTVTATVGTLTPGAAAIVTFGVKINP